MAEETKVEEKVEEKTEATAAPAEETKAEEVKPNPLQRTIELTISRKELDARVAKALREKAKKAKFHGFRPGHAPAAMVRKFSLMQSTHSFLPLSLKKFRKANTTSPATRISLRPKALLKMKTQCPSQLLSKSSLTSKFLT
jgi:hypothetical protein